MNAFSRQRVRVWMLVVSSLFAHSVSLFYFSLHSKLSFRSLNSWKIYSEGVTHEYFKAKAKKLKVKEIQRKSFKPKLKCDVKCIRINSKFFLSTKRGVAWKLTRGNLKKRNFLFVKIYTRSFFCAREEKTFFYFPKKKNLIRMKKEKKSIVKAFFA